MAWHSIMSALASNLLMRLHHEAKARRRVDVVRVGCWGNATLAKLGGRDIPSKCSRNKVSPLNAVAENLN